MRLFLAALLFTAFATSADAQRHRRAIAQQGDLAVSVGFSGLSTFSISPLEGGVGLRYWAGDQTVLGTSVAVGGDDRTTESEEVIPVGDSEVVRYFRTSVEQQSASLSLWVEQHVGRRRSTVSPFIGASVQVGIADSERTQRTEQACGAGVPSCQDEVLQSVDNNEALSVGGGLLIGAEVKIVSGVTLSGAYTLGATYSDSESRDTRTVRVDGTIVIEDEDLVSTNGWQYGVGTTRVALSVYF